MTDDYKDEIRNRMEQRTKRERMDKVVRLTDDDRKALDDTANAIQGSTFVGPKRWETINALGFEKIGTETDAQRNVFRRGGLVVKFDNVGSDPWRNENEARNWNERLPRDALDIFAPVIDHADDYGWIAMRYADTENVPAEGYRQLLRELIVDHNLDMTDPHPDNVGVLGGRVVMIDYNFQPKDAGETDEEREALYETKLRNYGVEP